MSRDVGVLYLLLCRLLSTFAAIANETHDTQIEKPEGVTICSLLDNKPFVTQRNFTGDYPHVQKDLSQPLVLTLQEFTKWHMGYDVDVMTTIALEFSYADIHIRGHSSFPRVLYDVRTGLCDFAVSSLTKTAYRSQCDRCPEPDSFDNITNTFACCLEFSKTYFEDGMTVAVRDDRSTSTYALRDVIGPTSLIVLCGLISFMLVAGHLVWLIERKANPEGFAKDYVDGIGDGLWWSVVTMTTVGYGDKVPVTGLGRLIAVVWMLVGIFLFSVFNGYVLLCLNYNTPPIRLSGLFDTRMSEMLICSTTGVFEDMIRDYGLLKSAVIVENLDDCFTKLSSGNVHAVLYDRLPLIEALNPMWRSVDGRITDKTSILDQIPQSVEIGHAFEPANFAVAMHKGGAINQHVNRAVDRFVNGQEVYSISNPSMSYGFTQDSLQRKWASWNFPLDEVYRKPSSSSSWLIPYIWLGVVCGMLTLLTITKCAYVVAKRRKARKYDEASSREDCSQSGKKTHQKKAIISRETALNLLSPLSSKISGDIKAIRNQESRPPGTSSTMRAERVSGLPDGNML